MRPITAGPYRNVVPSWSRDGKSIYYASNRSGSMQVWRHSLENATEEQLTQHGGFDPMESFDGQTVYFSKFNEAGIWSMASRGGTESLVVADKPQASYWGYWAVTKAGLYFLDVEAEPKSAIEFYDFATRRISPVLTVDKQLGRGQPSFSASMDGKTIYFAQMDQQSAIKMIELAR